MNLPAITLIQPWATLLVSGRKTVETRTHGRFRHLVGKLVAIHAGMRYYDWAADAICDYDYGLAVEVEHLGEGYPRGAVLGVGRMVRHLECTNDDDWRGLSQSALCDALGLHCYEFADLRELREPVPARGHQGAWGWKVPKVVVEELNMSM